MNMDTDPCTCSHNYSVAEILQLLREIKILLIEVLEIESDADDDSEYEDDE